jgi:hypothetical protein
MRIAALALAATCAVALPPIAAASTYEERDLQRRCEQEQRSLDKARRGTPSCDQLDRVYGIQKAPKVIINSAPQGAVDAGPKRVYDAQNKRWCWVYSNGAPMQCD